MIVLDACVVLKWALRDEQGATDALKLRARHVEGVDPAAVPDLLFYEVANVLALHPSLTPQDAAEAWSGIVGYGLLVYSLPAEAFLRTIELARSAQVTAYDAAYVALAEGLGCDFVTADRKLAQKLEKVGVGCTVRTL